MKLPRRKFLRLAAGAAALPAMVPMARAQVYPTRPLRLLVGFAAGGPVDLIARLTAQSLSDRLGQSVIVENRTGAGSGLAAEAAINAAPDGYTILFITTANVIAGSLNEKLTYNFRRDIAPVGSIIRLPNILEVSPLVPARTVPEFINYAKSNPGKVSYASSGSGTAVQLSAELFKLLANVNLIHVPYSRGLATGAYSDLMTGRVHVLFDNLPGSLEFVRTGKLRGLAVTTATRSPVLPELPTVGEFVPGYEASAFYGVGVPKNTPAAIIDRLNNVVNAGLRDPTMKAKFADLGGVGLPGSTADFARLLVEETEKWAKVIRAANIKPE